MPSFIASHLCIRASTTGYLLIATLLLASCTPTNNPTMRVSTTPPSMAQGADFQCPANPIDALKKFPSYNVTQDLKRMVMGYHDKTYGDVDIKIMSMKVRGDTLEFYSQKSLANTIQGGKITLFIYKPSQGHPRIGFKGIVSCVDTSTKAAQGMPDSICTFTPQYAWSVKTSHKKSSSQEPMISIYEPCRYTYSDKKWKLTETKVTQSISRNQSGDILAYYDTPTYETLN